MKNYFAALYFVLIGTVSAQLDISASMGLDFKSSSTLRDYLNINFAPPTDKVSSFKSAVSFTAEADYKLSQLFAVGLEYNMLLDSYNTPFGIGGIYELSYSFHRPSLLAYYIFHGEGYQFKLGGGFGIRYLSLSERIFTKENYNATGMGITLKAEGNTMFSHNFYALIGANFRYDITGDVSNGSTAIINRATGEKLNLNSVSFGIYLGVTFFL